MPTKVKKATAKKATAKKPATKKPGFNVNKKGKTKKDIEALFPDGEMPDNPTARAIALKLVNATKTPVTFFDLVDAADGSLSKRTLGRTLRVLETAGHFFEKTKVETDKNKTGSTSAYTYLPNANKSASIARHDGPDATGVHPKRSKEAIEKQKATRAANRAAKSKGTTKKRKRVVKK